MAVMDMPLDQLREYRGTNPCPQDFDQYWQNALAELAAIEPRPERKPAALVFPGARCYNLYFTGTGGARVHAKLLAPVNATAPCPAVLQFHGYSGNAGDWSDKLAYVHAGFVVAAMDCRGQGGASPDTGSVAGNTLHGHFIRGLDDAPDKMLYRQIFLDTVALAQLVMEMEEVDESRVMTMGISQGGALSLACAALEPRVFRSAALHPFLSDYQRVWQTGLTEFAYKELVEYFRLFDPLHQREEEVFTRLGYIDVHHLARRIKASVLMGLTLADPVCPPSSQFAAYNNLPGNRQALVYPDYGHELPPGYMDAVMQFFLS